MAVPSPMLGAEKVTADHQARSGMAYIATGLFQQILLQGPKYVEKRGERSAL